MTVNNNTSADFETIFIREVSTEYFQAYFSENFIS